MTQALSSADRSFQTCVSAGVLVLGVGLAVGALTIPSAAGYAGVGPNFLPWVVSIALTVCGGFLLYEAQSGGFRQMDDTENTDAPAGAPPKPSWAGFAWMSAGLLANAALITTIGFIFSCTLCFVLAARGLRLAGGQTGLGRRTWLADSVTGLLIAAPVFWMFTKFLGINLPGITGTGWL